MNIEPNSDALQQRLEISLANLPEWRPPSDFSTRLAAAAVRQAAPGKTIRAPAPWAVAVENLRPRLPMVLWSGGLAAMLAWVVPWTEPAAATALVWTCVAIMGAAGLGLTLRVLRAP